MKQIQNTMPSYAVVLFVQRHGLKIVQRPRIHFDHTNKNKSFWHAIVLSKCNRPLHQTWMAVVVVFFYFFYFAQVSETCNQLFSLYMNKYHWYIYHCTLLERCITNGVKYCTYLFAVEALFMVLLVFYLFVFKTL